MKLEKWMIDGLRSCVRKHGGRYQAQEVARILKVSHPSISRWQEGDYSTIDDDAGARLVAFLSSEGIKPPEITPGEVSDSVLARLLKDWPQLTPSARKMAAGVIDGLLSSAGRVHHAHP